MANKKQLCKWNGTNLNEKEGRVLEGNGCEFGSSEQMMDKRMNQEEFTRYHSGWSSRGYFDCDRIALADNARVRGSFPF